MTIRTASLEGIAGIEIARPEKKNALTQAMYLAMASAITAAVEDRSVRALLITGQPGIFTAGNDLEDFRSAPPLAAGSPTIVFMQALLGCEKPVVAAVTGAAIGIGATMLLHCDLVYLSDQARLVFPFVTLGVVPEFGSSLLLPRLMGYARAPKNMLLAEPINALRRRRSARHCYRRAAIGRCAFACQGRGHPLQRAAAGRRARHQAPDARRDRLRNFWRDGSGKLTVRRASAQSRGPRSAAGFLRASQTGLQPHMTDTATHSLTRSLAGKTLFITGASRGIGLAIATRAARDGARIVLVAKTVEPNPRLPGTLASAAAQIEAAGGEALIAPTDIRDENAIAAAVRDALDRFGSIDILINNASAISLTSTPETPMKRFDLLFDVDVRGTFACTQACLAALTRSAESGGNPQVLNLSPPLSLDPRWFAPHVAYTMAKYGMSMCTLGHAPEFRDRGIAVNSLWPRTLIATAALQMIPGLDHRKARTPQIVAEAAWWVLTSDARAVTGNFFIDEALLTQHGVTDLDCFSVEPGTRDLLQDLFVD